MKGIGGWLLVYLVGSLPVQLFYAAGLSGWFFDYPVGLLATIFLVLAAPLVMVVLKRPAARAWNIAALWVGAGLISLRILYGVVLGEVGALTISTVAILITIKAFAIAWAMVWTMYFLRSDRVAKTFGRQLS